MTTGIATASAPSSSMDTAAGQRRWALALVVVGLASMAASISEWYPSACCGYRLEREEWEVVCFVRRRLERGRAGMLCRGSGWESRGEDVVHRRVSPRKLDRVKNCLRRFSFSVFLLDGCVNYGCGDWTETI
jgi:hypothetical protein